MSIKLLCIGDVHLGRRPSKIPAELDAEAFGQKALLGKCLEIVKTDSIDAVLFVGDIVDEKNALFAGYGALSKFIDQLSDKSIPLIAVAGNHDFDILPTLAKEVDNFTLLGQNDQWEEYIISNNKETETNSPAVRILGRSFCSRHQSENPLANYTPPTDQLPTIGLLHCDVNSANSLYAPVSLNELQVKAPDAWLLGHIHKPTSYQDNPPILYLGSLQGLDPAESGARGPWLVEVEAKGKIQTTHLALAELRYQTIEIDLSQSEVTPRDFVLASLLQWQKENIEQLQHTKVVMMRIVFSGDTNDYESVLELAQCLPEEEALQIAHLHVYIEKVSVEAFPRLDLKRLSEQKDPPGILAKRLLILEKRTPADSYRALIAKTRQKVLAHAKSNEFSAINSDPLTDDDALRSQLMTSGAILLNNLLAQKDAE